MDTEFIWKVSQLLEISFDRNDPIEMSNLRFIIEESLNQMFTNFTNSEATFIRHLEGSPYDAGVPGLPVAFHFQHLPYFKNPEVWNKFVTLFRYYALEFYRCGLIYANSPQFLCFDFTYSDYPVAGNTLGFILSRKNVIYDIG